MSLFDEMIAESNKKKATSCQVRSVLEQLSAEEREQVTDAILNDIIDASTIATVLSRRGYHVNAAALRRHRRYECSCGRMFLRNVSPVAGDAAGGAEPENTVLNIVNERNVG